MPRPGAIVTDAELSVLEFLWEHGPSIVREISFGLYSDNTPAYHATVNSLLDQLEKKQFVTRDRSGFAHRFAPAIDRADLVTVNLGPAGEWFLKVKNGRMWWSGITEELDRVIADILNAGNYLHFLDFGDNGSYFISYDD